ncbi:uncharacterized protein FIESC28_11310 [Fusarium coffeatum]|uniref:Major facilitator superfamily (MFS) profile domain-containing protein n=1 Tax=Fusarium coffeatum TaxID=231269 RepID=A0A366QLD6_9HYPO|nr:uncharacterized protein FIESC28_11310 [Fusarium coffeatum]RBR05647.1 hypothetical protein FIESC28_11310 [Fusarium coffeatum]
MPTQEARETIQDELHIEVLPGTEIMTDIGKEHYVRAKESDQVLVPQPSQDPHDPLNWSPFWKFSAIFCVSTMTFTQGFAPLALAPMFPDLIRAYDSTLEDVIQFTGVTILILGFSNFFCLNGIGAGPSEILQPAVIADIFFLHDRGTWNALYWVVYMGSLMIAPIIAGPMADRTGWKNFWWLNVAVTALSIILGIFGFPETKWTRIDSIEAQGGVNGIDHSTRDKPSHYQADAEKAVGTPQAQGEFATDAHLNRGTPSKLQWQLFQPNSAPLKSMILDIWTPWKLFIFQSYSLLPSWSAGVAVTS